MSSDYLITLVEDRNCLEAKRRRYSCREKELAGMIEDLIVMQKELQFKIDALDKRIEEERGKSKSWFCRLKMH